MEKKRELTKNLLAESFRGLLIKGSFEKITIKMITDDAGVIRPTFYNYFQDKYEVMEWLLETEIFQEGRNLIEAGMEREAIYMVFKKMEKERVYYQKAFEVTGQNGFEEILTRGVEKMVKLILDKHTFQLEKYPGLISVHAFVQFQTITVVSGLRLWLLNKEAVLSAEEAMEFYLFLTSHSLMDIIN